MCIDLFQFLSSDYVSNYIEQLRRFMIYIKAEKHS